MIDLNTFSNVIIYVEDNDSSNKKYFEKTIISEFSLSKRLIFSIQFYFTISVLGDTSLSGVNGFSSH